MPVSSGTSFRSPLLPPVDTSSNTNINHTNALLRKAHSELQNALLEVQRYKQEAKEAKEEAALAKKDRDALVREMELLHISSASLEREVAALTMRLSEQFEKVIAKKSRVKRDRMNAAAVATTTTTSPGTLFNNTMSSNIVEPSWHLITDNYDEDGLQSSQNFQKEISNKILQDMVGQNNFGTYNFQQLNTTNLSIVATSSLFNNTAVVDSSLSTPLCDMSIQETNNKATQESTPHSLLSPISKGRYDLTRMQKENERLALAIKQTESTNDNMTNRKVMHSLLDSKDNKPKFYQSQAEKEKETISVLKESISSYSEDSKREKIEQQIWTKDSILRSLM
jgi:hypothetical protein